MGEPPYRRRSPAGGQKVHKEQYAPIPRQAHKHSLFWICLRGKVVRIGAVGTCKDCEVIAFDSAPKRSQSGELRRFFCPFSRGAQTEFSQPFRLKIFYLGASSGRQFFSITNKKLKFRTAGRFIIGRAFCKILKIFRFFLALIEKREKKNPRIK